MEPLATSKRVLTWLCLLPAKKNTTKWERGSYVALLLALIVSDVTVALSSFLYILNFKSHDLQDISIALFQFLATIPVANTIIVAFIHRHKIPAVLDKLSKFYGKYKDDDSLRFLTQANNRSEWFWDLFFKFVLGGFIGIFSTLSVASVLLCLMWNGYFDVALVFHPCRYILPWDQSTIPGYFAEIAFSILTAECYIVYNGAILLSFVSICLHHQAFYNIFYYSLRKLGRPNEKELLCDLVDFHNSIKSWFSETADIYSPHFMVQLIINVLMLAIFVFQLDQQISKHFEIYALFLFLFGTLLFTTNLFLCCFFGKLASESYKQMSDSLYDYDWHELPLYLQKQFIIMIAGAQIPLDYYGYGIITLNLETFCALLRAVYTYYMIIKTLSTE
ncbi:putative odorant receptor 69a [Sitodiplosis mosellana]|uniref:putative odorant receptor 69a n=1 Tax=Sitodiplosis mosellana TaxID=263140 RepID=UPI0024451EAA|nr:putative odorant receptor 69a [Sitodiplosis mosellana]